jgi:phosphopantetheine--protein transferase-like protein
MNLEKFHLAKLFEGIDSSCFSVGVDIEELSSWRERSKLSEDLNLFRKLFTPTEYDYCISCANPLPHFAVRWCAKEAVFKSLSKFEIFSIRKIEIRNDELQRPEVYLDGRKPEEFGYRISISLSHTELVACAFAVSTRITDHP